MWCSGGGSDGGLGVGVGGMLVILVYGMQPLTGREGASPRLYRQAAPFTITRARSSRNVINTRPMPPVQTERTEPAVVVEV